MKPDKPLKPVKFGDSEKARIGDWVMAHRQPVRPRRHRDGGHRVGPQPRYLRPVLWPVHPDRRGHQQGQFRRPAVQHGRRGDRHQHGYPVAARAAPSASASPCRPRWPSRSSTSSSSSARPAAAGSACASRTWTTPSPRASASATPRGALVAGIDDKGPAKPAGIEAGDVILKFDGVEVKESKDLPRIVGQTQVGKAVDVLVDAQGQGTHEDPSRSAGSRTARSSPRPPPAIAEPEKPADQEGARHGALGITTSCASASASRTGARRAS